MRAIEVCVGSSCHLKGAYDVINQLKQLIDDHELQEQVELKACFCMNHCIEGVNVRWNGAVFSTLTKDEAVRFFAEHVLSQLSELR